MNEKVLRTLTENIFGSFIEDNSTTAFEDIRVYRGEIIGIAEALADEPDVVKALRWANEKRAYYLDEVSQTHDCLRDTNFYKGKAGMAAEIQAYCQQFVRLTETGWEWTE